MKKHVDAFEWPRKSVNAVRKVAQEVSDNIPEPNFHMTFDTADDHYIDVHFTKIPKD